MMKTSGREQALTALFNLIEQYETPPERDASTDEGASWWSAWAEDLNALAATCQRDPLMLYLLAAYTDYMCDAGKALAETGCGLKWDGRITEVLIRLTENRVPLTEVAEKGLAAHEAAKAAAAPEQKKGGWIA